MKKCPANEIIIVDADCFLLIPGQDPTPTVVRISYKAGGRHPDARWLPPAGK